MSTPVEPHARLRPCRVVAPLGADGMGEVFRAQMVSSLILLEGLRR